MAWTDNLFNQIDPFQFQISQAEAAGARSRKEALKQSIIVDKELDDITRQELLDDLSQAGFAGTGGLTPIDQLEGLEKLFATVRSSQDEKYKNRRAFGNAQKERKDRPGLAAQTILTQNVLGTAPVASSGGPGLLTKGMASGGSGGTILT